jgi:hypothetical protein
MKMTMEEAFNKGLTKGLKFSIDFSIDFIATSGEIYANSPLGRSFGFKKTDIIDFDPQQPRESLCYVNGWRGRVAKCEDQYFVMWSEANEPLCIPISTTEENDVNIEYCTEYIKTPTEEKNVL